ncbi:hypothetical protein ACFQ0B_67930 [Nonomuraea thailandensis]
MIILATMFAGTAVYRAEQGTISWRAAWITLAVVAGCGIPAKGDPAWAPAIVLAFAVFGLAYALRGRSFPAGCSGSGWSASPSTCCTRSCCTCCRTCSRSSSP